jgi:hypothetical protein
MRAWIMKKPGVKYAHPKSASAHIRRRISKFANLEVEGALKECGGSSVLGKHIPWRLGSGSEANCKLKDQGLMTSMDLEIGLDRRFGYSRF